MQSDDAKTFMEKIDELMKNQTSAQLEKDKEFVEQLPPAFLSFLQSKGIAVQELLIPFPRYIRVKPNVKITCEELAASFKIENNCIAKVDEEFFAIVPSAKISHSELYQKGCIYGMDYSSCIPVRCLLAREGDRVLELCSAPGNKSMYLADHFQSIEIVGVEINENRANVMKNLIKKYKLENKIRVEVTDGMKYDSEELFDRVLVDAECTHEGSMKHIKKFIPKNPVKKLNKNERKLTAQQRRQYERNNSNPYTSEIKKSNEWTPADFQERFLDPKKLENLSTLQYGLLQNGFRLLKEGGKLVYSTCSLDESQNEKMIQKFIDQNPSALLESCESNLKCQCDYQSGSIKGTIRFSPSISRCGGMFICRIVKNI